MHVTIHPVIELDTNKLTNLLSVQYYIYNLPLLFYFSYYKILPGCFELALLLELSANMLAADDNRFSPGYCDKKMNAILTTLYILLICCLFFITIRSPHKVAKFF